MLLLILCSIFLTGLIMIPEMLSQDILLGLLASAAVVIGVLGNIGFILKVWEDYQGGY
jgi:hypothetical protein